MLLHDGEQNIAWPPRKPPAYPGASDAERHMTPGPDGPRANSTATLGPQMKLEGGHWHSSVDALRLIPPRSSISRARLGMPLLLRR